MSVRPFRRSEPQFWVTVETESGEDRLMLVDPSGRGRPAPDNVIRILSFQFTDSERRADTLRLTVDNFNLTNFDDPVWKKGNILRASWGYPGRMAPVRELVVTKVTGFQQLAIEARAQSVVMNRVVQNRRWSNTRRSDVVREIAQDHGFEDVDIEDTGEVHESIQQARLTDAQFLRRLATDEGFEFYVDWTGLHWHRRRTDERPARRFRFYTDPNVGEILSITIENDITARPARVVAAGRDPLEGEDVTGDSGAGGVAAGGDTTLTPIFELIDPATGGGRRNPDYGRPPDRHEENIAQAETRPTSTSSNTTAERQARGRARRHRQMAVRLKMEVVGDPQCYAKTVFQLDGVGRRLSIRYYAKEIVHSVDTNGYKMAIAAVSDGHGGHSTSSRAAQGIDLIDPGLANRGRQNNQEGEEQGEAQQDGSGDARPTEFHEAVDPATGRTRITWRQPSGRASRSTQTTQPGQGSTTSGGS